MTLAIDGNKKAATLRPLCIEREGLPCRYVIETPLSAPIKTRPDVYEAYARHTVIGRWGQPPEVGSAVAFLASDAASYISGSTMLIDAGWTAIDGPPTGLTQVG